ncbi:MAG: type II toxin-antitoxin system death-on-curing family toxin [Candidatus Nanopelagicales bacterium]
MSEPIYLTIEDLLGMVRALGAGPVRDLGLLDSAIARPRSSVFGQDAYSGLPLKAAALLHSLVRNHALVDGNKRIAWLAAIVFLDLNGCRSDCTHEQAFDLVMSAAVGVIDVPEIAEELRVVPLAD